MSKALKEIIAWTGEERLEDFLKHHYGIRLQGAEPIRGVLKLETDHGRFVLKRVRRGEKDRWRLIDELAKHVARAEPDQNRIPSPILTESAHPYFNGYRYSYVLLPWIEANPISLNTAESWKNASRALASFHQSTRGFVPAYLYRKYQHTSKWLYEWDRAYRQLEVYQLAAKWATSPTRADLSWLDTAAYTTGMMENLLEYYHKIDGDNSCRSSIQHGKVCHNNVHRHNLLTDQQKQTHFVDWNEMVLDVRTRDIAQWLLYAYGRTGSQAVLTSIIQGYQEVAPLDESEYPLIYARFLFPEKLFKVLESVYQEQTLSINSAAPTIHQAAQMEEKKVGLLRQYTALVKDHFHITIPQIDWISR